MISELNISMYSARKTDKKATNELRAMYGITEVNAIKAGKRLLPEEAPSFKAITQIVTKARTTFRDQTLPWNDSGARILPSANFMNCTEIFRVIETEFYTALPIFWEEWPLLKKRAEKILNGLYREEDYPSLEKLKKRFSFALQFYPLPDAEDFRADISAEAVEAIKQQIEFNTQAKVARSMEEPYLRLLDGVAHMASRLQGLKECPCRNCVGKTFETDKFGDSVVNNLINLCDVLPRLNLTADKNLDYFIEKVKIGLTPFQPDLVRSSEVVKKALADTAREIQEQMSAFFAPAA